MPGSRLPKGFDPTDPSVLAHGQPHREFAELRRTAPVTWITQPRGSAGFDDEGYWAVTRHCDVMAVSRDSDTYSSWQNTAIVRFRRDIPRENIDMQRAVMLNIDPPYHTKLRTIVARGFTPRAVNALRGALRERAERIVREAAVSRSGEFVTDIACELPLQAIAELIGVPQEDRKQIFEWSNRLVGYDEPDFDNDDPYIAAMELLAYAMAMAEERQSEPRNDIVTKLISAQIDGSQLTIDEFGFFVILLSVAGNETTRNAITHGMLAFFEHPDEWERYKAERPKTAVDEIIRWASPVNVFQRTATRDVELGGQRIRAGDRVCIFYGSANFDEEVFDDPYTFDVTRSPNPHLGFGGSGAHYCLGANLARLEIELMFNAIADHIPHISMAGAPERLHSGWVHGIKALPVYCGEPAGEGGAADPGREDADPVADVMAQFAWAHRPAPPPTEPAEPGVPAQRKSRAPRAKATPAKATPAKAMPAKRAKKAASAKKAAPGKQATEAVDG